MKTKNIKHASHHKIDPHSQKILIADDDEATRILLRMALTQWGYRVIEATNGEEAWEILQGNDPPKILILDWVMPKLDGIGLCRQIENNLSSHPYIIFLTRMAGTENVIQGLEVGADEFILKPFDLSELRIRIFAGERIIKYRNQLAEQHKELEGYISNMKKLAEQYAKELVPFADLEMILQKAYEILSKTHENLLNNKEPNDPDIQKTHELLSRLKNIIDIIKGFKSETAIKIPVYKTEVSPAISDKTIVQTDVTIIDMKRMEAFFGTDMAAIQEFIKTFISLASEQIIEIGNAVKNKDPKAAKYYFHLLGSASGNSGMMKLYDVCGKAEAKVSQANWESVTELYHTLQELLKELQTELAAGFKKG